MSKERTKITFTTKDKNDKEISLDVRKPSAEHIQRAQIVYASTWQQCINNNPPLLLRAKLDKVLRSQGLWDDDKDNKQKELLRKIRDDQLKILKGGLSVDQGVQLSLGILKSRGELNRLLAERNRLDANTAEAQADNAQFNFLVSQCTVFSTTGDVYFANYQDYLSRSSEQAAREAAEKLMTLIYDIKEDAEDHRPEVIFLKNVKRMNDKGQLVKNDKLTDLDGKYINEDGQYIDENNNLVDEDGTPIDAYGVPIFNSENSQPFVDEAGNSVSINFVN